MVKKAIICRYTLRKSIEWVRKKKINVRRLQIKNNQNSCFIKYVVFKFGNGFRMMRRP